MEDEKSGKEIFETEGNRLVKLILVGGANMNRGVG